MELYGILNFELFYNWYIRTHLIIFNFVSPRAPMISEEHLIAFVLYTTDKKRYEMKRNESDLQILRNKLILRFYDFSKIGLEHEK